jgi:hypothetical protein
MRELPRELSAFELRYSDKNGYRNRTVAAPTRIGPFEGKVATMCQTQPPGPPLAKAGADAGGQN